MAIIIVIVNVAIAGGGGGRCCQWWAVDDTVRVYLLLMALEVVFVVARYGHHCQWGLCWPPHRGDGHWGVTVMATTAAIMVGGGGGYGHRCHCHCRCGWWW